MKKYKKILYNKLIRDKIPQRIIGSNQIPKIKVLNKKDFNKELKYKIMEEAKELIKSKTKSEVLDELVDIEELITYIAKENKIKNSEIEKERKEKNKIRGSFKKRLFLEYALEEKIEKNEI